MAFALHLQQFSASSTHAECPQVTFRSSSRYMIISFSLHRAFPHLEIVLAYPVHVHLMRI